MLTAAVQIDSHRPRARASVSTPLRTLAERNQLVDSHMYLVQAAAGRMRKSCGRCLSMDELVAFGTDGLLDAADRFDPSRGASFATFSFLRIRGAILDGLRSSQWFSREDVARFRAESEATVRQPGRGEAAGSAGAGDAAASVDERRRRLSRRPRVAPRIVPFEFSPALDQLRAREDGDDRDDFIDFPVPVEGQTPNPEQAVALGELGRRLRRATATLPAREREVIERHYFADEDLHEVGAALGVQKWTTSRLHSRAVRLLRDALIADGAGEGGADASF